MKDGRPFDPSEFTKSLASPRRLPPQPDIALEIDDELQTAAWRCVAPLRGARPDRSPADALARCAVGMDTAETTRTRREPAGAPVVVGGADRWAILAQEGGAPVGDPSRAERHGSVRRDGRRDRARLRRSGVHQQRLAPARRQRRRRRAHEVRLDCGERVPGARGAESRVLAAHDLVVVQGEPGTRDQAFNQRAARLRARSWRWQGPGPCWSCRESRPSRRWRRPRRSPRRSARKPLNRRRSAARSARGASRGRGGSSPIRLARPPRARARRRLFITEDAERWAERRKEEAHVALESREGLVR